MVQVAQERLNRLGYPFVERVMGHEKARHKLIPIEFFAHSKPIASSERSAELLGKLLKQEIGRAHV